MGAQNDINENLFVFFLLTCLAKQNKKQCHVEQSETSAFALVRFSADPSLRSE